MRRRIRVECSVMWRCWALSMRVLNYECLVLGGNPGRLFLRGYQEVSRGKISGVGQRLVVDGAHLEAG